VTRWIWNLSISWKFSGETEYNHTKVSVADPEPGFKQGALKNVNKVSYCYAVTISMFSGVQIQCINYRIHSVLSHLNIKDGKKQL